MGDYKPSYRIWESAPGVYELQYSFQRKGFFTGRVTGEYWRSYGSWPGYGAYQPDYYYSVETAEEALEKKMAEARFVPRMVREYTP